MRIPDEGGIHAHRVHLPAFPGARTASPTGIPEVHDLVCSLVLQEPPAVRLFASTPPTPGELARLMARRPAIGISLLWFGLGTVAATARLLDHGDVDRALHRFCTRVLGAAGVAALSETRRQQLRDNAGTFYAQLTGDFPALNPAQLRAVTAPTLLVTGAHSHPTLIRLTHALAGLLPHVTQVHIPDAAHFANEANPAAYNQAVLAFLSTQTGLSGRYSLVTRS